MQTILEKLSKNGCWGGNESLCAIRKQFEQNILVLNEESSDCYFVAGFDSNYDQTMIIAYRLNGLVGGLDRNHYDSVVSIDPNDICSIVKKVLLDMEKSNKNKIDSVIDLS